VGRPIGTRKRVVAAMDARWGEGEIAGTFAVSAGTTERLLRPGRGRSRRSSGSCRVGWRSLARR
jgi:hypothetical protein